MDDTDGDNADVDEHGYDGEDEVVVDEDDADD